jgi:hypothetical protein
MPFAINRWACSHCKRFVRADKKRVELHEQTCFDNPSRRSCRTCNFEVWDEGRGCSKDLLVDKYAEVGIRWDCIGWEKIENYG